MTLRYLSVCSGIEAATVAWHPLGFKPVAFAEIEKFPSAVLAHHYPNVPNIGDMRNALKDNFNEPFDLLVGGTPCQSFSLAGLRAGLDDPRGQLALVFCQIAAKHRPKWIVWENVPGALSAEKGEAFKAITTALAQLGYDLAWRVLDAQYVRVDGYARAVPQRRRRVFLVGCLGGRTRSAAVLFDRESVSGDSPPSRFSRKEVAFLPSTHLRAPSVVNTLTARMYKGVNTTMDEGQTMIGQVIPFDPTQITSKTNRSQPQPGSPCHTLVKDGYAPAIAYNIHPSSGQGAALEAVETDIATALSATAEAEKTDRGTRIVQEWRVRRLTPIEAERLQGFPDGYTAIPFGKKPVAADSPRYRSLGNSMAVNVMRWIGERVQIVNSLP